MSDRVGERAAHPPVAHGHTTLQLTIRQKCCIVVHSQEEENAPMDNLEG